VVTGSSGRPEPHDELDGQDEGDGEGELAEALSDGAVGVAAELAEVRQPRVGAFGGPAQPEGRAFFVLALPLGGFLAQTTSWSPTSAQWPRTTLLS